MRFDNPNKVQSHIETDHLSNTKLSKDLMSSLNFLSSILNNPNEQSKLVEEAKKIVKKFASTKMDERNTERKHINYWLLKKPLDEDLTRNFSKHLYIGESNFVNRPEEHFVESFVLQKANFELSFKQKQILDGDWIAVIVNGQLTKNEAILMEHVALNSGFKNILNTQMTADSSIYDHLNEKEESVIRNYIIFKIIDKLSKNQFRAIDKEKLNRKAAVLMSNKLKNK